MLLVRIEALDLASHCFASINASGYAKIVILGSGIQHNKLAQVHSLKRHQSYVPLLAVPGLEAVLVH